MFFFEVDFLTLFEEYKAKVFQVFEVDFLALFEEYKANKAGMTEFAFIVVMVFIVVTSVFIINLLVDNLFIVFLISIIAIANYFVDINVIYTMGISFAVYFFTTLLFRSFYHKAAESGDAQAQFNLGKMYFEGEIRKYIWRNYEKAVYWYRKAAEQGHVEAQFNLGDMYVNGKGVSQDNEKAFKWYDKVVNEIGYDKKIIRIRIFFLVEQGVAEAQYRCGLWYKKAAEQIELYHKAAEQGHVEAFKKLRYVALGGSIIAQNNLGEMYANGKGVTQNNKTAIYWYEKAAENGSITAQNNLGEIYANGKGVTQNNKTAVYWYEKAAIEAERDGFPRFWELGERFSKGKGINQDYVKAAYWYEKAAKIGGYSVQHELAGMYATGKGIKKDSGKADYWYSMAEDSGREESRREEEARMRIPSNCDQSGGG